MHNIVILYNLQNSIVGTSLFLTLKYIFHVLEWLKLGIHKHNAKNGSLPGSPFVIEHLDLSRKYTALYSVVAIISQTILVYKYQPPSYKQVKISYVEWINMPRFKTVAQYMLQYKT